MPAFASFARQAFEPSTSTSEASSYWSLPNGPCKHKVASHGSGLECGCQRFWLHTGSQHVHLDSPTCFCGHHACYHQYVEAQAPDISRAHTGALPSTLLEPFPTSSGRDQRHTSTSLKIDGPDVSSHTRLSKPQAPSPTIYQESWARNALRKGVAPSSYQLMGQATDHKHAAHGPSAGPSLAWLNTYLENPYPVLPRSTRDVDVEGSLTEVATMSIRGSPPLDKPRSRDEQLQPQVSEARGNLEGTLQKQQKQSSEPSHGTSQREQHESHGPNSQILDKQHPSLEPQLHLRVSKIESSLKELSGRLEALENVSFWHGVSEDVRDKVELFEGRVLDLEYKLEEFERGRLSSAHRRSPSQHEDPRISDDACTDLRGHRHRLNDTEMCIDSFAQARSAPAVPSSTTQCTTALTTLNSSVSIELVILPWGPDLRGIWKREAAFTQEVGEEFESGLEESQAHIGNKDSPCDDSAFGEWRPLALEPFFAEACAPTDGSRGQVYRRLESRGLVRRFKIPRSSALDCYAAIYAECAEVLDALRSKSSTPSHIQTRALGNSLKVMPLLGLETAFVPLRKVHKSSRLRFLSPSELLTPALWTAAFLEESVCMKVPSTSVKRLYITSPSAYLQHGSALQCDWRWPELEELPRGLCNSPSVPASRDAVITIESKTEHTAFQPWAWNPRLDHTPKNPKVQEMLNAGDMGTKESSCLEQECRGERASSQQECSSRQRSCRPSRAAHGVKRAAHQVFDKDSMSSSSKDSEYGPVTPISEFDPWAYQSHDVRARSFPGARSFPQVTPNPIARVPSSKIVCKSRSKRQRNSNSLHPGTEQDSTGRQSQPSQKCSDDTDLRGRSLPESYVTGVGNRRISEAYATPHSHNAVGFHCTKQIGSRHAEMSTGSSSGRKSDDNSSPGWHSTMVHDNVTGELDLTDEDIWEGVKDHDENPERHDNVGIHEEASQSLAADKAASVKN